jgi:16S rRNA processing protein RimM
MTEKKDPQEQKQDTGSLDSSEPVFLAVGKLRRPHGLRGEIAMEIYTDFPERLHPGVQLYLGEDHLPIRLENVRQHQELLLVTLDGFQTREAVGTWRNTIVYVLTLDRPALDEGEYYHHQLIGLRVFDENGEYLGRIEDILETGANDVFIVRADDQTEFLLPYLDSLVIKIDLEGGKYYTRLLPGLLDED